MMRKIRIALLCGVAVLAFSAVAAASASAQPTFKTCEKAAKVNKKYTGGYNNKTCTEVNGAGEGKYAAKAVATPLKFEGKSATSTLYFYTKTGHKLVWKLVCKKDKVVSEINGPNSETGTVTFEKCEAINAAGEKTKCSSSITLELDGYLGEVEPAETPGDALVLIELPTTECGSFKFSQLSGYEFGNLTGISVNAKANPTTFEPEIGEFLLEGEYVEPFMEAEVAGTGRVDVSVETTEPVGPKKGVVIIP